MECNKDEATRAMSIAESKLEQRDFLGAKKFALKAQTLYPGLQGISQMLITLDVHLSAEIKTGGEIDWYRVLDANPSNDHDTIKKQYRKLALLLHPDKNKSVGAENAFKLISEAWKMLSDKEKREAYDRRRGYMGFQQYVLPTHTGGPSAPCKPHQQTVPSYTGGQSVPPRPGQQKVPSASPRRSKKKDPSAPLRKSQQKVPARTGASPVPPRQQKVSTQMGGSSTPSMADQVFNFASSTTSTPKSQNGSAKMPRSKKTPPYQQRSDTFWTVCRECNTYFEYLKLYHNQTLLCRSCDKPFLALDSAPPVKFSKSVKPVPWGEHASKNLPGENAYDSEGNVAAAQRPGAGQNNSFKDTNYQQGPLPETANTDNGFSSKPDNVVQQARGYLKRTHTESHAYADLEGCFKKGKLDDDITNFGTNHYMARGNSEFGAGGAFEAGPFRFSGTYSQQSTTGEMTPTETRNFLVLKTQKEILKKLGDSGL